MKNIFFLILTVGFFQVSAQTPVQNFTLVNVVDAASVSLEICATCSGVAVVFTSNTCPYDKYYTDRIKTLVNAYPGKIQFLLINSHLDPDDAEEKMKEASAGWGLSVPYLADKGQVAMSTLGAKKSPEVFLIKNEGGKFFITYSGALDDNPQVASAVTQRYLKAAIDKLLSGSKVDASTVRAVGCTIRRK